MSIPLIELKVRNMEHAIIAALSEHELKISEEIKEGVKLALEKSNIHRVVAEEANRILYNQISILLRDEMKKQLQPIPSIYWWLCQTHAKITGCHS